MSRCLRCGAGSEWLEGKVKNEPMNRPSHPSLRRRVATVKEFRKRLERMAQAALDSPKHRADYPRSMSCYKRGYRQALRDAGVDVFHVRARTGGSFPDSGEMK